MTNVHWEHIQGVIFDIDGTLYEQKKLRRHMFFELIFYYLVHPYRWRELLILSEFRRCREAFAEIQSEQSPKLVYDIVASKYNVPVKKVKKLVSLWIIERPLRHLRSCRFPGVSEFIYALNQASVKVGIFSDYPGEKKLGALELPYIACVSSEDSDIDRLKPHPRGLKKIAEQMGLSIKNALFIGDRNERDGLCASKAGMQFLLLSKQKAPFTFNSYFELLDEIKRL